MTVNNDFYFTMRTTDKARQYQLLFDWSQNDEFMHMVATYDGAEITTFINGEKKASLPATGTILYPDIG